MQYSVSGIQVYDARLVAAMCVYQIEHLLTLNVVDSKRYKGVSIVHPTDVLASR
ncbi:MAG: hypothetical protein ABI383_04480 [Acidobacteriaceae bacterium]